MNKFTIILFIFTSSSLLAQSADLELEVYMESSDSVFFGFEGSFSVTVRNNGPDVAENPGTASPLMSLANTDYAFIADSSVVQENIRDRH